MNADWLLNWSMVFLRAGGLLVVFPVFSSPSVPTRLRVALGAMLAFLIAPGLPAIPWEAAGLSGLVGRMTVEVAVGILFGSICRFIFYAMELAGALISAEIGLSLPAGFNPMGSTQGTLPGAMLSFLGVVLWLSLDLHHWLLVGFKRSFELLPVGVAQLSEPVLNEVLTWAGLVFVVGLQISAPVMAVSFIISLVFAVLGRAVAQMNVFTESFAVRLFVGLTVFGASLQLMAQQIANYFNRLPEDVLRIAVLLRGPG
jgi:flagellar biosynthetic protein FliR